jgi:hypothetical protein
MSSGFKLGPSWSVTDGGSVETNENLINSISRGFHNLSRVQNLSSKLSRLACTFCTKLKSSLSTLSPRIIRLIPDLVEFTETYCEVRQGRIKSSSVHKKGSSTSHFSYRCITLWQAIYANEPGVKRRKTRQTRRVK